MTILLTKWISNSVIRNLLFVEVKFIAYEIISKIFAGETMIRE